MRKWMDKGAAKAEGGTPAPHGVTHLGSNQAWRRATNAVTTSLNHH